LADGLYLGKVFDPATETHGEPFEIKASDLTTHGIVIGMTGSGKTGLSIVLIEEALQAGIPVIVIDPKGDMGNLGLAFPELRPEDFAPWVDTESAARDGLTPEAAAAAAAKSWTEGLADWDLGAEDLARYAASREVRIITPGSTAGIPLNLIESLDPPGEAIDDEEEFRDQVDAVVTALLGLLHLPADPVSSPYILLFTLIENYWRQDQGLTLESLVGQVASPPIDKLGALPLDVVYPPAERHKLMLALNSLLASPPMAVWRQGEPVDLDAWLRTADGLPRANIVYTSHLEEEQRIFVTALLLNKVVSWVRRQSGTGELRCLLYMDEIFGYFPPTANPPTKKPLLTLLKQARAYGLGVLLSTQNPVDLDYRGLANMGFWAIGRLQTTQDQDRVRTGIEAALADSALGQDFDALISGVQKRVFLVHDIHRKGPALVHSRWAMSYLRGPITRDEIERLNVAPPAEATATAPGAAPPVAQTPVSPPPPVITAPPPLPSPLRPRYLDRWGGNQATPHLFVKAAVRYKVGASSTDESVYTLGFRLDPGLTPVETLETEPVSLEEEALTEAPPSTGLSYADLPAYIGQNGARGIERALKDRLDDRFAIDLLYDPYTKAVARPGETADDFAARLQDTPSLVAKRRSIETKLEDKRGALAAKQQDLQGRSVEKWASLGNSILSNIGLFTGKKRRVTGVSGTLSKQRMEANARLAIERLEADVAQLETELAEAGSIDPSRFELRTVRPSKSDLTLIRYDIVWVY
jgi:hypothetical protein